MKRKLIFLTSLLLLKMGALLAQVPVTGIVVDELDDPVIGASILIKGTGREPLPILMGIFLSRWQMMRQYWLSHM